MLTSAFYFIAFVTVFFAVMVIAAKNPVHSVLYLVLTFFGISANYIFILDAPFVGIVNIIVYAGAIMVLFLFVVMLLNAPHEDTDVDLKSPLRQSGPLRFGAVLALGLVAELIWALARSTPRATFSTSPVTSIAAIGRSLFTDYAFQFEVTSVLILVAMVGAVLMARREEQPGGKG